jgi:hypothetical protein
MRALAVNETKSVPKAMIKVYAVLLSLIGLLPLRNVVWLVRTFMARVWQVRLACDPPRQTSECIQLSFFEDTNQPAMHASSS